MLDGENPENLIEVDLLTLDKNLLDQPRMAIHYGRLLAKAKLKFAEAKAAVDICWAEVAHDVRLNPTQYGVFGTTSNDKVEEAVHLDGGYQACVKAMNQAQYEVDDLYAIVEAIAHRRSVLDGAIRLHGQMYFSTPSSNAGNGSRQSQLDREDRRDVRRPVTRE